LEAVFCVSVFLVCGVGVFDRGYWLSALFAIFPGMFEGTFEGVVAATVVKTAALFV